MQTLLFGVGNLPQSHTIFSERSNKLYVKGLPKEETTMRDSERLLQNLDVLSFDILRQEYYMLLAFW